MSAFFADAAPQGAGSPPELQAEEEDQEEASPTCASPRRAPEDREWFQAELSIEELDDSYPCMN